MCVAFVIAIPELDVVVVTIGVDCAPWARLVVGLDVDAERVPVVIVVVVVAMRESSCDAASEAALNALPGMEDVAGSGGGIVEETDVLTVKSRAANSLPFPVTLKSIELGTS